jgi:uncharacterized membrane protein
MRVNAIAVRLALRRGLKILHTLGAAGFMGGLGSLLVVLVLAPGSAGGAGYGPLVAALAQVAQWVVGPAMVVTVVSGLLAMAANPAFYEAGWVWVKLATGILVLEGGLHVLGPFQEEAGRAVALGAAAGPEGLRRLAAAEAGTMEVLLAVSAANIVLGVWRPRFMKLD